MKIRKKYIIIKQLINKKFKEYKPKYKISINNETNY